MQHNLHLKFMKLNNPRKINTLHHKFSEHIKLAPREFGLAYLKIGIGDMLIFFHIFALDSNCIELPTIR